MDRPLSVTCVSGHIVRFANDTQLLSRPSYFLKLLMPLACILHLFIHKHFSRICPNLALTPRA